MREEGEPLHATLESDLAVTGVDCLPVISFGIAIPVRSGGGACELGFHQMEPTR